MLADRLLLLFFRVAMGWIFLFAAYQQFSDPNWTAATFLGRTKTAHEFFAWFGSPTIVLATNVLVKWGHILIGISLFFGIVTRLGASLGAVLMFAYYIGHMDFPFVETRENLLVDYHLIYVGVLIHLIINDAGTTIGLDNWFWGPSRSMY